MYVHVRSSLVGLDYQFLPVTASIFQNLFFFIGHSKIIIIIFF